MRSDAIDQVISTFLEMPARVSWSGALADSARGHFDDARLELAGMAVLALPVERLVLEARRFQFIPGIPARFVVEGPRLVLSIDQRQIDAWLDRARAPFNLRLSREAVEFRMDVAGFPISRAETELRISRGWIILHPKRQEFLGVRNRLASLFRTYLPLPRLAPQTRLTGVEHDEGLIRLELTLDDFEDVITPGLVERVQERFLPFAKPLAAWSGGSDRRRARAARDAERPARRDARRPRNPGGDEDRA